MKGTVCLMLVVLCLTTVPTAAAVGTGASAAILMEAETGRVLYEQNIHQRQLIASTTKLMTALVALESGCDLRESVKVKDDWVGIEGSSIYLREGEEITLEALLYGLLLRSGNDAAVAVAGICGGAEAFVAAMNQKAAELGMADSHFENPSGLDGETHYSTAYDMALLARACLQNETLAKIAATKSVTLGTRTFTNHNKLLWRYEGCVGLKTGYTEHAGRTLVSAAQRNGMTLICVTLNDPNDWADHAALLDYGFANFGMTTVVEAGETVCTLPTEGSLEPVTSVCAGDRVRLCLGPGENWSREVCLNTRKVAAPLAAGAEVGVLRFRVNGAERTVPLVTGETVQDNRTAADSPVRRLLKRFG